jgi:hypothetical protein
MIRVSQECEGEFILGGKLLVRSLTVYGYTQYLDATFPKVSERIAKRAGLFSAPGRIIFGIKIEHHFLATQSLELNSFTVRVIRTEIGRYSSFFEHVFTPILTSQKGRTF